MKVRYRRLTSVAEENLRQEDRALGLIPGSSKYKTNALPAELRPLTRFYTQMLRKQDIQDKTVYTE